MATATLNATITGGTAPVPIAVRLFAPDMTHFDVSSSTSFAHTFNLTQSGGYQMFITGINPAGGGQTKFVLTPGGGASLNPPNSSPATPPGTGYSVQFNIQVP